MNCKRRHRPKDAIRRAIVPHLTARAAPELWWRHVPNSGSRAAQGCARNSLTDQQTTSRLSCERALF
jgi:hypothetical protein